MERRCESRENFGFMFLPQRNRATDAFKHRLSVPKHEKDGKNHHHEIHGTHEGIHGEIHTWRDQEGTNGFPRFQNRGLDTLTARQDSLSHPSLNHGAEGGISPTQARTSWMRPARSYAATCPYASIPR